MDFTPPEGYEEAPQSEFDPLPQAIGSNKLDAASYVPKLDDAIKSASGDTKLLLMAERRRYAPTKAAAFTPPDGYEAVPEGYEEVPKEESEWKKRGRAALGGIEAAADMAGNMPAYIAGGLTGLSRFIATGGDINKARETQEAVQNGNFGFGAAAPVTEYGKVAQDALQQGQQAITDKAEEGGSAVGGNLGQSTANFAANTLLNFMPIPGGKMVGRMGRVVEGALERPEAPTGAPKVDPEAPLPPDAPSSFKPPEGYEEVQHQLFEPDNQGKAADPYGAAAGDWRVDENGIPIRADLSMDAQNAQAPLQRNLWGDQLDPTMNPVGQAATLHDVNGMQESIPLSEAIDKMPEGPGRTQAMDQLSTNAIEASPELQGAVAEAQRATSIPQGQRGGIDIDAVAKTLQNVMDKTSDFIENLGKRPISPLTDTERKVVALTGDIGYIPKPDNGPALAKALTEPDGKNFFSHLQSGPISYGDKVGSTVALTVGRWLSYGTKIGERYNTIAVRPVARILTKLNPRDLVASMGSLRDDMFNNKESSVQDLKDLGHSDKAIEAHMAIRQAYKQALDKINKTNEALGKPPVSPKDAYMASIWDGQWHTPILDKAGNVAWYIKGRTRAEAKKAIEWMKKQPELADKLALDKAEPKYMKDTVSNRVPHDQIGEYQALLNIVGDHPAGKLIKEALEQHIAEQGYNYGTMKNHLVPNKGNVRGFMGDRPWLDEKANAIDQAKAQVQYLAKVYNWSGMQEALAGAKELLAHPELNEKQPNNMWMAKAYTAQAMGVSKNIFKPAEQWLQKWMTTLPSGMKFLPSNINKFVGSLKNMTYLTQLGLSGGYMIATPLQAFLLGPARHMQLSDKGFKYNFMTTATKALLDFSSGLTTGHAVTQLGKDAFKYMYENGVISQNIFHETTGLGENKAVHAAMKGIGWTISMPEKVARAATFMSFVHHLAESGKIKDQGEMFRRAEELTNHTLTDFRRMSRPLAVDHFGALGELAYTYKSPMFNQYNSLMEFARDAKKGKPGPLLAALGMSAIMGGMGSMPLIHEMNIFQNVYKDAVAKAWPDAYPAVSGLGVAGSLISGANALAQNHSILSAIGQKPAKFLADTAAYGLPSAATGSQMASRFSSSIGDITKPLENIAPVGQELREWAGAGGALANHNIAQGVTQGFYDAVAPPAVKGFMETHMDYFKGEKRPDGKQVYVKPTNIETPQASYARTPSEEFKRNFGLTSLEEANTKTSRYISGEESARFHTAQEASLDKMWGAIRQKNKDLTAHYARAYFKNNGDEAGFSKGLEKRITGYAFTPEERQVMNVGKSIANLRNYERQRAIREGN